MEEVIVKPNNIIIIWFDYMLVEPLLSSGNIHDVFCQYGASLAAIEPGN